MLRPWSEQQWRARQEQDPRADVFQDSGGPGAAMGSEIVQDHHVAFVQGRGQLGFDVEIEEFPVDRPADNPGRVEPVMAQGSDESLGVPVSERDMIDQTCPAWRPSGGLGQVGFQGGFVDKPYVCQHVTHEGLAATDPDLAGQSVIRPLLLDGAQVFFCVSCRGRAAAAKSRCGGPQRHALRAGRPPTRQGSGRAFP